MSPSDMERLETARLRWEAYLHEVRPLLWQVAELYALARPYPRLTEEGRLVMAGQPLPERILDQIDRLNTTIAEIARQHGIERMPPPPPQVAAREGKERE